MVKISCVNDSIVNFKIPNREVVQISLAEPLQLSEAEYKVTASTIKSLVEAGVIKVELIADSSIDKSDKSTSADSISTASTGSTTTNIENTDEASIPKSRRGGFGRT